MSVENTRYQAVVDIGGSSIRVTLVPLQPNFSQTPLLTAIDKEYAIVVKEDLRKWTREEKTNPNLYYECVKKALLVLAEKNKPARIEEIGFSCFAFSMVGVDANGNAVTELYHYASLSSGDDLLIGRRFTSNQQEEEKIVRSIVEENNLSVKNPLHPCFPLFHMASMQLPPTPRLVSFTSLSGFIIGKLCGTGNHRSISFSEASWWGLYDVFNKSWIKKADFDCLFSLLALSTTNNNSNSIYSMLPPVCEMDSFEGQIILPNNNGTIRKVFLGVADGACAAFACCFNANMKKSISLTIGTSSAIRKLATDLSKQQINQLALEKGLFVYLVKRDLFVLGGALIDGGSLIDWIDGIDKNTEKQEKENGEAVGRFFNGITVLPFFSFGGERNPTFNVHARSMIYGMNLTHDLRDLRSAMRNSITLSLFSLFETMMGGEKKEQNSSLLVLSGNALLHSNYWLDVTCLVFEMDLYQSTHSLLEDTSRGVVSLMRGGGAIAQTTVPYKIIRAYEENDNTKREITRMKNEWSALKKNALVFFNNQNSENMNTSKI